MYYFPKFMLYFFHINFMILRTMYFQLFGKWTYPISWRKIFTGWNCKSSLLWRLQSSKWSEHNDLHREWLVSSSQMHPCQWVNWAEIPCVYNFLRLSCIIHSKSLYQILVLPKDLFIFFCLQVSMSVPIDF